MFLARKLAGLTLLTTALLLSTSGISTGATAEVLTNAADILALSPERASDSISVSITGVVTAAEPNWGGRFFVQDASGGVFVNSVDGAPPSPGDIATVAGITTPGGYAPCIDKPHWMKSGTGPMPKAKVPTIEQFMTGNEDSQRIELSGIVRSASTNIDRLSVELVSGAYRFRAHSPIPPGVNPQSLVGARVRIRGTAAVFFNATLRRFLTIVLYAPSVSDFIIEQPAPANPFDDPLIPLNATAQYRNRPSPSGQVHVRGLVTYQRLGEDLFLQDDTGGLQIKCPDAAAFSPGDIVEAVGFPGVQNFLPVLEDAILRKCPGGPALVLPNNVPMAQLQMGLHNAELIMLQGKLLDRQTGHAKTSAGSLLGPRTVLVIQTTNLVFTAEDNATAADSFLSSIPIGSTILVSGVCLLQSAEDGKTKSIQLLLPSSANVRILASPGWLTPQHLLVTLAAALMVILIGSTWIIMALKRNTALRQLIYERELGRKELQKAHDSLEQRVKERTRQLKVQITARKEADLQSKAVLSERTRLAKELHDTIEQTMTGVTLQLNAVAKLLEQNPETAGRHLGLARNMVRTSRVDLRRSIWDLRTRELEQFDLAGALLLSGNQIADGANIGVKIETGGTARSLPEIMEENILRIGQEAITNAVKHSGATQLRLGLDFHEQNVVLTIKDNGNGFTPDNCLGPNEGHFGLLGMSERAKRLVGTLTIESAPGTGTTITVDIPTEEMTIRRAVIAGQTGESMETDHEENIPDTDPCR
ncbi:MAG TPA: histidine kinase [Verrucomicrobiae bacterium]|jgi:signal transduction histidine kinase|nr:histidine kinase [Verrucomicrobiae bacterium]